MRSEEGGEFLRVFREGRRTAQKKCTRVSTIEKRENYLVLIGRSDRNSARCILGRQAEKMPERQGNIALQKGKKTKEIWTRAVLRR